MQVLLLDNYDSFTYILRDYLLQCKVACAVLRNDTLPLDALERMHFDALVLSPGPGRPADAGIMPELIAHWHQRVPMLGVCLGMQALGEFFGAELIRARQPMHGKTDRIACAPHPMFEGVGASTEVMRYHSLILRSLDGVPLIPTAYSSTGEVMAMAHSALPLWGVQFHPESALTPQGLRMLRNWIQMASSCRRR